MYKFIISGTVKDANNQPAFRRVLVFSRDTNEVIATGMSDSKGEFRFSGILGLNIFKLTVYAKAYPSDGSVPVAGVYIDNSLIYQYSRDWHISVWDPETNDWATGISFPGASAVNGAHARFDTYGSATAQRAAFVNSLNGLPLGKIVIISGSHAPERLDNSMRNAMYNYGASVAKLNWNSRNSYILVGEKGLGTGNAFVEELNNLPSGQNSNVTWCMVEGGLSNFGYHTSSEYDNLSSGQNISSTPDKVTVIIYPDDGENFSPRVFDNLELVVEDV